MIVEINGERRDLEEGTTLLALLERHVGTTRGSAVVLDGSVVPRAHWPDLTVREGQTVELITAVQGG